MLIRKPYIIGSITASVILLIVSSYYISIIYNHCIDYKYTCELYTKYNDTLQCYMKLSTNIDNNYTESCQDSEKMPLAECINYNNIICYSRISPTSSDICPPTTSCNDSNYGAYYIMLFLGIYVSSFCIIGCFLWFICFRELIMGVSDAVG
jgi:hypothetical protein